MRDFMIYILQVNLGLVAFYLLYRFLFVRDTHLGFRRFSLLFAIGVSFIYPLISIRHWLAAKETIQVLVVDYAGLLGPEAVAALPDQPEAFVEQTWFTPENILIVAWGIVCLFFLGRLLVRLYSVFRLRWVGFKHHVEGVGVFVLNNEISPFSFFGWIFINPSLYDGKGIREIIAHEKAHARQFHSFDVMTGEILVVFFWFNPVVWLMLSEIRQNLEFLADRKALASGCDRKDYQYHLLRLSYQSAAAQIINNFNVSQLKKRIIMMNKKRTSGFGIIRYALLFPVAGILVLVGNDPVAAQNAGEEVVVTTRSNEGDQKQKQFPWFPGGIQAILPFFSENMKYSPEVIEAKVKGEVTVKFTVPKAGGVTNPKILKGLHPSLDKEVLRVVETMSAWEPAEKAGRKVGRDVELVLWFSRPDGAGNSAAPSVMVTGMNTENFKMSLKDPALAGQEAATYHFVMGQERKEDNFVVVTSKSRNAEALTAKAKEISVYTGDPKKHFVIVDGKWMENKDRLDSVMKTNEVSEIFITKEPRFLEKYSKVGGRQVDSVIIVETKRHIKYNVEVSEVEASATNGADSGVVVTSVKSSPMKSFPLDGQRTDTVTIFYSTKGEVRSKK